MKQLSVFLLVTATGMAVAQELRTVDFPLPRLDLPKLIGTSGTKSIMQGESTLLASDTPKIADLLPVTKATIEYYKKSTSGSLTPFFGTATAAMDHLVAIHTFCKYLPVSIAGKTYAFGVKTSIRADFKVKSGSLTMSLFGIGAAGNANKVEGTIQVSVEGISGPQINDYISMPAKLDETTITKALEDFAVIKSKLYETDTILIPMLIGVYE